MAKGIVRTIQLLLALVGVIAIVLLMRRLGFASLLETLRGAVWVLPLCMLAESARVLCEAIATRFALGDAGKRVPFGRLFLAQFSASAVGAIAPAPRPLAEATKASILAPWVGAPEAASAGATMQAATFVAVAWMSGIEAIVAACAHANRALVWLLVGNSVMLFILGFGLRVLFRADWPRMWVGRRFPKYAPVADRFHAASSLGSRWAILPSLGLACGLLISVSEIELVAQALGERADIGRSLIAHGVQLVVATLAVFVPGQLGARETAFAMASKSIGASPQAAASIAIATRGAQLLVSALGFAILPLQRTKVPPRA